MHQRTRFGDFVGRGHFALERQHVVGRSGGRGTHAQHHCGGESGRDNPTGPEADGFGSRAGLRTHPHDRDRHVRILLCPEHGHDGAATSGVMFCSVSFQALIRSESTSG